MCQKIKNSNGNDSSKLGRTPCHVRATNSSLLGLLSLLVIANLVTLPMISCFDAVTEEQYSLLAFHKIGCNGTYYRTHLKILSQVCYRHSEGYDDLRYKECRKKCFTTDAFKSSAAMHHYVVHHELKADAWVQFEWRIKLLNVPSPRT